MRNELGSNELGSSELASCISASSCFKLTNQAISNQDVARIDPNMQKCASCQFCRYCSPACQRAAWREHKHACPGIGAAFQGALRREWSQVFYGMLQQDEWLRWVHIMTNLEDYSLPPGVHLYVQHRGKGKGEKGKGKGEKGSKGKGQKGKGKDSKSQLAISD